MVGPEAAPRCFVAMPWKRLVLQEALSCRKQRLELPRADGTYQLHLHALQQHHGTISDPLFGYLAIWKCAGPACAEAKRADGL